MARRAVGLNVPARAATARGPVKGGEGQLVTHQPVTDWILWQTPKSGSWAPQVRVPETQSNDGPENLSRPRRNCAESHRLIAGCRTNSGVYCCQLFERGRLCLQKLVQFRSLWWGSTKTNRATHMLVSRCGRRGCNLHSVPSSLLPSENCRLQTNISALHTHSVP